MQEKQDEKTTLPVEMPKSLHARLKARAKEVDRSMAWCARKAIEQWLAGGDPTIPTFLDPRVPSGIAFVGQPATVIEGGATLGHPSVMNPRSKVTITNIGGKDVQPRFKKGK